MSYIGDTMKLNIHEHRDSQFTNFIMNRWNFHPNGIAAASTVLF